VSVERLPDQPFPGTADWLVVNTRTIRVLVLQCCVAIVLLCSSSPAAAQAVLSCDSRTDIVREKLPRLAAYQPDPSQLAALKKAGHRRFGPFDRATYGFSSVDIYLRSLGASEDSFYGHYGPVEIVVRLGSRTPRWFKVVPSGDEYADKRMLFAHKDISADPETVQPATDDPRVPLFVVRLGEDTGRGSAEWQHVIDFRPKRRRLPVAMQCYSLENQGACGTWDAQYGGTSTTVSCAWEPKLGDFRCAMTEQLLTPWGGRTSQIEQTLIDTGRLPPRSLDGVLQRLAKAGPGEIDAALAAVSEFTGPARLVMQRPTPDGGTWMLVGVGGRASFFDARFTVIRVQNGQPTVHDAIELPLGPDYWLNGSDSTHAASALRGRVTPSALAMQGSIVFEQPDLIVAQVHVREGEDSPTGSSAGQAIYWVGISLSSSGLIASSLRLATDTSEYFRCAQTATPPNALAWTVKPAGTFTAEVEIEPPHEVDLFTGEPLADGEGHLELGAPACATTAVVTWRDGFAVSHQDAPSACRENIPARFVLIDDRGRIQLAARPGATGLERN
jgi:hypothetical protein